MREKAGGCATKFEESAGFSRHAADARARIGMRNREGITQPRGVSAAWSRFVNSQFCGRPHVGSTRSFRSTSLVVTTRAIFPRAEPDSLESGKISLRGRALNTQRRPMNYSCGSPRRYSLNRLKMNVELIREGRAGKEVGLNYN